MLFGETVAVYCENHTEHTDTLCGQDAEFWGVEAGGTYIKGLTTVLIALLNRANACEILHVNVATLL
jgi:hypothetical protein